MINLKMILSAAARTFGISSPEDLRKQKRVASKSDVPRVDSKKSRIAGRFGQAVRRSIHLNRQRDTNRYPRYRKLAWEVQ